MDELQFGPEGTNGGMCSFCGKLGGEVGILIAGPDGEPMICDECISLCLEIIMDQASYVRGTPAFMQHPPPQWLASPPRLVSPARLTSEQPRRNPEDKDR
jgi:hypothetical protein